ncbi:cytochrome c [Fibrobacterota bacterium]
MPSNLINRYGIYRLLRYASFFRVFILAGVVASYSEESALEADKPQPSQVDVREEISKAIEASKSELRAEAAKTSGQGAELIRGKRVYNDACAGCHGRAGDGNGVAGQYLNPRPRDFTKGVYKFRSTPSGELPTDEDLYLAIAEGIQETTMPAYNELLSEQELRDVLAYTKAFCGDFQEYGAGEPIDIPQELPADENILKEGKYIYMILGCWTCHGTRGKGDGPSAPTLKDDDGFSIEAFDFTRGVYRGGADNKSIYKTMNTGMDGTPMAAYADLFLYGNNVDLEQYFNDFPESDVDGLKEYLSLQPSEEEIKSMSEEGTKDEVAVRRKWALVHYLKSLTTKPGFFYQLFGQDTEVTKGTRK